MPNDKIVTKLILHPSFLAKSYYPQQIFDEYDLKSLGSKEIFVKPEIPVNKEQESRPVSSSLYYVAGKKQSYEKLLSDISNQKLDSETQIEIGRIEDISFFLGAEKIGSIKTSKNESSIYEVVLHADQNEKEIISYFATFLGKLGGSFFESKTRSIGNLTFCFIEIDVNNIEKLATFSYVRVVRPIANIKLSDFAQDLSSKEILDTEKQFTLSGKQLGSATVAIFDGGLMLRDFSNLPIRYFDLTNSNDQFSDIYSHGECVTSSIVFGQVHEMSTEDHELIPVDHFKVFCEEDDGDIALVNVLDRIESVLKLKQYKIVNISVGPCVPRPDDDPSLWTATLDKLASDGHTLIIVAAGNSGEAAKNNGEDLARIQPPGDMLNGLSIGAADSRGIRWSKASYSSIGPGRRPGYVKPDALFFGGEIFDGSEKINIVGLSNLTTKAVFGTSFATPLVTRLAAIIDKKTFGKLNVATIRSLLIHSTENNGIEKKFCGWGRIPQNIDNILYCSNDSVTLIYQGALESASGVRAAIPWPNELNQLQAKVNLTATLCFYTEVDQEHTVSYTRNGVEVVFRPHRERFTFNKETQKYSSEATPRSLFNKKNILGNEQSLRKDFHKWETCYKVTDSFYTSTAFEPTLDLKYLTRDEGHPLLAKEMKNLKPLQYSLVVTIQLNKNVDLYSKILEKYTLLSPLDIQVNNLNT